MVTTAQRVDCDVALRYARLDSAPSMTVDLRLCRAGGGAVPFAMTFTNLLDDPTLEGIVVTGHDISDRVTAEDELRETNSLLATTLESTADGIVVDQERPNRELQSSVRRLWRIPDSADVPRRQPGIGVGTRTAERSMPSCKGAGTCSCRRHTATTYSSSKTGRVFRRDSLRGAWATRWSDRYGVSRHHRAGTAQKDSPIRPCTTP